MRDLRKIAHDLRSELSTLCGFTELLELEQLAPHQRALVGEIKAAGRRLLALVDQLLPDRD